MQAPQWRRVGVAALVAALAGGVALTLTTGPGRADFATECANPTVVINGNSQPTINLAAGQVALIASGTFTGGIDALAGGSVLCVAAGATLQPAYINNAAGRLLNEGTTTFPAVVASAGVSVENGGSLNFPNGFNNNGPVSVLNKADATITVGTG